MKTDGTAIYLNAEELALFLLFQKYYDKIGFCIAEGAFDIWQGSATLRFQAGKLKTIERQIFSYDKTVDKVASQEKHGIIGG